jgi:putative membrane protein
MTIHWVDGGLWFVALVPLLLWVLLLVLGIILLVRLLNRRGPAEPSQWGGDSAEEVLRRRFAAGEIDEEEYRRRLDVLRR